MKFPNIKPGDRVIGQCSLRDILYPLTVKRVTPTRFTTEEGTTFQRSDGYRWGNSVDRYHNLQKANPFDEESWTKATFQQKERDLKEARVTLVLRVVRLGHNLSRIHLENMDMERLKEVNNFLVEILYPNPTPNA